MDMENLTKEELDEIMADPRLSKAYKAMQADYTRKTQGISSTSQRLGELEAQLAEANDYLMKWEAYGAFADPIVQQFNSGQFGANPNLNGGGNVDGGDRGSRRTSSSAKGAQIEELLDRIAALEHFAETATQEMNDSLGQLHKMFNYSVELNELQLERFNETGKFDLDTGKVLKTAMEKKLTSLKDAYENAYKDERVKTAAERRAEEIVKERDAKFKTEEGEHRSSTKTDTVFKLDPDRPRGFGEATEQALKSASTPPPSTEEGVGGKSEK